MTSKLKTIIIAVILASITALAITYTWHQDRKSNDRVRTTTVEEYQELSVAMFAGGCFWCTEADFEKTIGVVNAISGYTGGPNANPTYNQVSSGRSGHIEAVQVFYDPELVSYDQLLDVYWRHNDPTDAGGSFGDRGEQYSSAIYYYTEEQKIIAELSKATLDISGRLDGPIVTPILAASEFYLAEDYHQDYHTKNSIPYNYYRNGSGRNDWIKETWGDELKKAQNHGAPILELDE